MLVYTVLATELLEPRETAALCGPLAIVEANLREDVVEAAMRGAGLTIARKDVVGTQWREHEEERTQPVSQALLQLARLRRRREEIVERYGGEEFEIAQASLHWLAYLLLGKLRPTVYVLEHAR